jgi:hypothetical protein
MLVFLSTIAANSAQAFELLMSTTRTACRRDLGGSMPNSWGGSPLSTQAHGAATAQHVDRFNGSVAFPCP